MTEAEELADLAALLPAPLLATLRSVQPDDAFLVIQQQRPTLTYLEAVKTLTAFQLYRVNNAFRETVNQRIEDAKTPSDLPTRLPRDVTDHIAQVLRTAVYDLYCGNLRSLEITIIKAYAQDDPARSQRSDNLDRLYEERLGLSDLIGALIVDQARSLKLEPPRCIAARAAEILELAAVVLGFDAACNQWVVSRTRADDDSLLLSVPGRPSIVLNDATPVTEHGDVFVIGDYRFRPYYK